MSEFEFDEPYVVIERHESSVGSFLFGVAIGAGIALLFAPHAGAEMRRTVRKHARRVTRRAQNLATEVSGTVTDGFQQAREEVENRLDAARNAIELKRAQVSRAVEAGRRAAHDARDDLERRIAETKAAYDAEPGTRRAHGTPDVEADGNGDDPTV
ncbi:MAG TPA: YtxH domain-containing protein [Gemmatimonadaceae bacterium]|nr:YtxH domain-containing protein [Gemmatimonadaceae bacterium]